MFENATGMASVVAVVLVPLVSLVVWVAKKMVPAILRNMEANTAAIEANADATRAVATMLKTFIAAWDERDVRVFQQLDRIERNTEK